MYDKHLKQFPIVQHLETRKRHSIKSYYKVHVAYKHIVAYLLLLHKNVSVASKS